MPRCPTCHQELPAGDLDGCEEFRAAYPRKDGKLDTQRAWKRLTKTNRALVMKDLVARRYEGVEKQFIPHAATYLNHRRWEDPSPTLTIPDPPKPALPDGGLARRVYDFIPEKYGKKITPEEARRRFAEIANSVKVKRL